MTSLDEQVVRQRMTELLAYLASAAQGNVDEPPGYGPYRLMQGVVRVIRTMEELGVSDAELDKLAGQLIDDVVQIMGDPDHARRTADTILETLSARLTDQASTDLPGASTSDAHGP